MSAFTNATASSGILRSEIPQLFFTEIKISAYNMLNSFSTKRAKWKMLISRINDWSDEEVGDELESIHHEHPDVERNFQYTVLKAVKTISTRNGNKDVRINLNKLQKISFLDFYRDFVQRIMQNSNVQTSGLYMALRPSDKEIIARDAFRQTLFAHSRNMFDELVVDAPSNIINDNTAIEPHDSVSQAPSEIISIHAKDDERLSESILKLHNSVSQREVEGGGGGRHRSQAPSRVKSSSKSRVGSKISSKSYLRLPPPKINLNIEGSKVSQVIECDIHTGISRASDTSKRRPRSHFTRSQRPTVSKVSIEPCFFEDDGIDTRTADVGTIVER